MPDVTEETIFNTRIFRELGIVGMYVYYSTLINNS